MSSLVTTNYDSVLESLVAWGAPLAGWKKGKRLGLEETLVGALGAAHQNAAVLRSLPLMVCKLHGHWDEASLVKKAREAQRLPELGFVVELAGTLSGDPHLKRLAKSLEPERPAATVFFFEEKNRFARELAMERTPEVAKKWGFWMNMPEDAFREHPA